eukprot:3895339-Pleurochrysis_carterae.AAC.1
MDGRQGYGGRGTLTDRHTPALTRGTYPGMNKDQAASNADCMRAALSHAPRGAHKRFSAQVDDKRQPALCITER